MSEQIDDVTVLRADFGAYGRWFKQPVRGLGLILALVGGSAASAVRGGDAAALFFLIAGTVVVTLGSIAILIATSRITLTSDRIEYRRWFLRTRLRLSDELVGALAEMQAGSVGRTSQVLMLRARSGGPRIRLNGAYWDHEDLVLIARTAGVLISDRPMTPRDYEDAAPGSMPFRYLHPWVFGLGVAVVLIAGIVGAVLAWFDHRNIPPFDEQPPRMVSSAVVSEQDSLLDDLQRAMGGEWESPESGLTECKDGTDHKGWSRRLSSGLRTTVVQETGEEQVVTPVRPSPALVDEIERRLRDHDLTPVSGELDGADTGPDGYVEIRALSERDGRASPPGGSVDVAFSGGERVTVRLHSGCEVPGR
ncbi:hypothetical protein [Aeromicrobium sp. NPDC092404]|uniref:hypothetical protein n=1 Tax=Aeromicrobium sp. NPDC092404 TaxID=3154976 RepID=UPI00343D7035